MRIFPRDYWYWYREDLGRWGIAPRSTFLELFVPVVLAMAALISLWCFALLVLPFLYNFYSTYQRTKPIDEIPFRFF